jgi:DNA-binding NtrC family response regulator
MSRDLPQENISSYRNHSEEEHAPGMEKSKPVAGTKFRILIVDDEVDLRAFLMEFCSLNGYEAECAGNGLAALERIENTCFHLAIVDYLMPEINGVEFVRRAKQRRPELPVIAMSAWYDMERAFLEAGAFKFMKKPFDPYQLEEELEIISRMGAK